MTGRQKRLLGRIAAGLLLFAVGLFLPGWWKTGFLLAAWLIAGYDVLWSAVRNILHGQLFDEKFLMSLATCCALGMQEWTEAAAVMLFSRWGSCLKAWRFPVPAGRSLR